MRWNYQSILLRRGRLFGGRSQQSSACLFMSHYWLLFPFRQAGELRYVLCTNNLEVEQYIIDFATSMANSVLHDLHVSPNLYILQRRGLLPLQNLAIVVAINTLCPCLLHPRHLHAVFDFQSPLRSLASFVIFA